MPMEAKIHPIIYDDPDWRRLEPNEKLGWFWLLTNSSRNNIGFTRTTEEKFSYDLGIPCETLKRILEKMDRSVAWEESSGTIGILLLNFVARQIPRGHLTNGTRWAESLYREATELPEKLRNTFFNRYADLQKPSAKGPQTHKTVTNTSPDGMATARTVQSRTEQYSSVPSDDEVLEFARDWPGEMTSGTPAMDPDWVLGWLKRMASRSGDWPANWQRAMIAAWRADFRAGWRPQPANQKNGVLFVNGHKQTGAWELKQRIELLRAKMQSHPGNTDSAACVGQPSDDETAEFEKICAEKGELERQLGAMA